MTINIVKKGRWGFIENEIPRKLEAALYNKLSYKKEGWYWMTNKAWAHIRLYNLKQQKFPWGLKSKVEEIVVDWCRQNNENYIIDCDKELIKEKRLSKKLRPYQIDAVNVLFENNGGILAMPTGSGKTLTAIEFLKSATYFQVLIVVTTIDLKNQWEDEIKDNHLNSVKVITYQSIKKVNLVAYDIVMFDECHHVSAKNLYDIALKCVNANLIGLSATPYRAYEPETLKIIAALGEIVYKIGLRELIEQGYLVDAEIKVKKIQHHLEDPIEWYKYHEIYTECIAENKARNKIICDLAKEVSKPCLILCERVEHCKVILESLTGYRKTIIVTGNSKHRKEKFKDIVEGKYDIVIASKIYGEGVNIPNLKSLILAGGGKSSVKVVQQVGRLLRLFEGKNKALIIDFDDKIKYLHSHFGKRLDIYNSNKFKVSYID